MTASETIDLTAEPSAKRTRVGSAEREFLIPWLCSAAVVTIIRFLHATDFGFDLTIQLEAAKNLFAGNGLGQYWPTADNLASPLTVGILTHFPAGYSLYAAALLALGAEPGTIVKISGGVATLLGWWGWARLAFAYVGEAWMRSRAWRIVAYAIAVVSPLLFTSPWAGTDIILWAATPWVLQRITRTGDPRGYTDVRSDIVAGLLIALCLLARYASLSLAAYTIVVVVAQCRLRLAPTARRLAALGVGVLLAVAVQGYINYVVAPRYVVASSGVAAGGVVLSQISGPIVLERAESSVMTLAYSNYGLLFWLPNRFRAWEFEEYEAVSLVVAGIAFFTLMAVLAARRTEQASAWYTDLRTVGAGLLIAVPIFLWTSALFEANEHQFIRDPRLYEPLRPLAVCVAFFMATMSVPRRWPVLAVLVKYISRAYIVVFLLMTTTAVGFMFVPTAAGADSRKMLVGTNELRPWPSPFRMTYDFSPARRFVLDTMEAQPDLLLLTNVEPWFNGALDADGSRIVAWGVCEHMRATYIAAPARLLIFARDRGGPPDEVQWTNRPTSCLGELPGLKLLRQFPEEKLKVLAADIPAGMRVPTKSPAMEKP